jgi:hypothetical protein
MNQERLMFKFEDINNNLSVLVGVTINYKIEMFVVGFHCQVQAGIAYMRLGGELLITSIIALCGYEDGEDYGNICHC